MKLRSLFVALIALMGTVGVAVAQDAPTGTWKWTSEFNGNTRESTLVLKVDGDSLSGHLVGRNGQEMPISEASVVNGEIKFKVVRERNGNTFTSDYVGKVEGNTLKGQITMVVNGETRTRAWEAKRGDRNVEVDLRIQR